MLVVFGAFLVAVAGSVAGVALLGSHPPAPRPAGEARGQFAGAPARAAPGAAMAAPASRSSARPWHQDPFGATAVRYLATRAGTVLAAVYDVATGQTWRLGQGQPQHEASVVKLDVLETLLARPGALSASDRSLARRMIEDSDNDAATSLWYEVGGASGIRSFNAAASLATTTPSSCVTCPGFPWPGWGLTTTVPADQLVLLKKLLMPGGLLTGADRAYALSLMENVAPAQRWGVSGGVPAGVTVALKNGWLPLDSAGSDWQINSVGWISGQGRNYLMAVLTTGNPSEQYGIDTIDHLAATVWAAMR